MSEKNINTSRVSAFDMVAAQPWAIQPDMLETISAIARRENESPEAVEARLGRPLQNARDVSVRDGVAIISVTGPVFRYANLFTQISGATSIDILARDFTAADEDPAINDIVMVFDTPGGIAAGISEFAQMVRNSKTHVTAYVDNMAASAGYWMAAAANEIVVSKTSEVGSVGAVVGLDTRKSENSIEIVSSQSPKKRVDVNTPEGREQIQTRIDALAQVFVEDVAEYRGVSVDYVLANFGQGDMRMGVEAVKLKMADRVSTLEEVIAGLSGSTSGGSHIMASNDDKPAAKGPEITRVFLTENHPEIVKAIESDAFAKGKTEGATAELARIQGVMAQAMAGHEDLINTLAFDGKTTGPEAAVQVLSAERTAGTDAFNAQKKDAPEPVEDAANNDAASAAASGTVEDRAQAEWDKSQDLQAEFGGNFDTFLSYKKANDKGCVKVAGKKSAA